MSEETENVIAAAIDIAEVVSNPLDTLVENSKDDPGAPFAPDILLALADLKIEDRPAFEILRDKLKRTGGKLYPTRFVASQLVAVLQFGNCTLIRTRFCSTPSDRSYSMASKILSPART